MNIKEAKKQIKNTVLTYLSKNEFNEYEIPLHKQRPIFLLGTPGIGKTAVMEQISQELNIGFVSYSMTHQSREESLDNRQNGFPPGRQMHFLRLRQCHQE